MKWWLRAAIVVLLLVLPLTYRIHGETRGWQLESTHFVPVPIGYFFEVSPSGRYIFQHGYGAEFNDTSNSYAELVSDSMADATRWWHDTILYTEIAWPDMALPHCSNPSLLSVGVYTATTKTKQLFCLNAPQLDVLERYPFDDFVLFGDSRYLIDLRANTIRDLQRQLPTQVSVGDTRQWVANGQTWWDPLSRLPKAHVTLLEIDSPDHTHIQWQVLQLCPLLGSACQPIVTVKQYIHGTVADVVLSPDGQTLLWSVYQIPDDELMTAPRPPSGIIVDHVAFSTNFQTGATQEIFRLSRHTTSPAKGISARWSMDGHTLVISMHAGDPTLSAYNGVTLATFVSK
jgi:hypothetical protein